MAAMLLATAPLQAKRVEPEKAERLAQRYVQSQQGPKAKAAVRLKYSAKRPARGHGSGVPGRQSAQSAPEQDTVSYYVFNTDEGTDGGFVIVAADDVARPVLGYSTNGSYDENNLPPAFVYWLEFLEEEIAYAQRNDLPQSDDIRQEWANYLDGELPRPVADGAAGFPLLQTQWNQSAPYYNMCPLYNGSRSKTGCVATAMAQILKYHNFPKRISTRIPAYTTGDLKINVPAITWQTAPDYDWDNMIDKYTSNATLAQVNAVATLMYHVGAALKMDYRPSESSANISDVPTALAYFGYDSGNSTKSRSSYSTSSWEDLLRAQLDAGLPVYYRGQTALIGGSGHAFVCDGYDNTGKFHFNWGWGGISDGYFVTSALQGNYNTWQQIIIDIKPGKAVTGVTLDKAFVSKEPTQTEQLTATVAPSNADNKNVIWSSNNPTAASVSTTGLVRARTNGVATITVTTQDGLYTANCAVAVMSQTAYVATVINGTGSGVYEPGVAANISANALPGQQFTNWTTESAGVVIANANNPTTTFNVATTPPGKAVTVTANYETISDYAEIISLTVDGLPVTFSNNTYSMAADCNVEALAIAVTAVPNTTVQINGVTTTNSTVNLATYGDNAINIKVTAKNGINTKTYTLWVHKPIPFEKIVKVRWNNTMTIINNPAYNGGYTFVEYKWFYNGRQLSTEQWHSAGYDGRAIPAGEYRVEMVTESREVLHSCYNESILLPISMDAQAYPNPVPAGGTLNLDAGVEEEQLRGAVVEVYNMQGKRVATQKVQGRLTSIPVHYQTGVYVLVLRGSDGFRKEMKVIVN